MKPDPKQLRLAADIVEHNHPWGYHLLNGRRNSYDSPLEVIADGNLLIPILVTPPDGRPLHNPDNLTAEQVGVGYRLALKEERVEAEATEFWYEGEWLKTAVTSHANKLVVFRLPLSVLWPDAPETKDPYAELKEAYKAGKTIQFNVGKYASPDAPDAWEDRENLHWDQPVHLYRVEPEAPDFALPPPPPGMKWHREDGWEGGDLPPGTRPLCAGEIVQAGDHTPYSPRHQEWQSVRASAGKVAGKDSILFRTRRPLTFQHAGKQWTYHRPGDPMPCDGTRRVCALLADGFLDGDAAAPKAKQLSWGDEGVCSVIGWRYAESQTKEVELGPEDVPPGSAIYEEGWPEGTWETITGIEVGGVRYAGTYVSWKGLQPHKINRSIPITGKWNPDAWEPCKKTINL